MQITTYGHKRPNAFVTINKQRIKQHTSLSNYDGYISSEEYSAFLKNGDEFEIELFNPKTIKIKVRITLNGKYLGYDLILNPGERVYLERFLKDNNKFKYETYLVDDNDSDVEKAIENNGVIKIEFFDEESYQPPTFLGNINTYGGSFGGPIHNNFYSDTQFITTSVSNSTSLRSFSNKKSLDKKETGLIGKGEESNQTFKSSYGNFSLFSSHTVEWKLQPKPEDVITTDDIKIYCTECGTKKKKTTFKFCPNCGNKF